MKISLTFDNGKEGFILPINPESIDVKSKHYNSKIKLLNIGEINLIGKKGVSSITLSSFFPSEKSHFRKRADRSAVNYVSLINKWKSSLKPIRVIIAGTDINLAMVIDSFDYTTRVSNGDISYTLELSEYIFLNAKPTDKKTVVGENGLKSRQALASKNIPKIYVVKKGDCLWNISKRFLGSGKRYEEIYKANKKEIDKRNKRVNKYTIYPNQRLVIPH